MSERKMCNECPFRPGTKAFAFRESWAKMSELMVFEGGLEIQPHGCHMLEDNLPCEPKNVCVGHSDWLNGVKHEAT